jgi:hypothetical protein
MGGKRGNAISVNGGETFGLVWVYRRADGALFSEEPMVKLIEEAQNPLVTASSRNLCEPQGWLILFPLDAVGCEILALCEYRFENVTPNDPNWPLPKLPTVGIELKPYGRTRGQTTYKNEIGALPAGHLRCQVWMSPRVTKECSNELIDVFARLTEKEFHQARDGGPSIAELLERPPLLLTPTDVVFGEDEEYSLITFQIPARCMGMVLGVFHTHAILAHPGNPMHEAELEAMSDDRLLAVAGEGADRNTDRDVLIDRALQREYDSLKSRLSDVMIPDNVIRNYAGWQQDMSADPRMGRPRRDEVNWYLDMLPDSIKSMVDNTGRAAYTMEAIASLLFERSSRALSEERRLITNLVGKCDQTKNGRILWDGDGPGVQPMKQYMLAEYLLHENGRINKRKRDNMEGHDIMQGSLNKVVLSGPTQHVDPSDGDKTTLDRLHLGDHATRAHVTAASDGLYEAQCSPGPSSVTERQQIIPDVHHLTNAQQRQLIECLYSRVVYHMHPNTLRIAKTISWIYFIHGKIGRFIGPYQMKRETYHRHLRAKAGEPPRALPWRPNRGSRAQKPKAHERKYVATESKRLSRTVVNTQSTAQSLGATPSTSSLAQRDDEAEDDEAEDDSEGSFLN